MGQFEELGDHDELSLDLELRACETCRRELLPWQATCPDDGGRAVLKRDLPPVVDHRLRRLLAQEQDGEDRPGDG